MDVRRRAGAAALAVAAIGLATAPAALAGSGVSVSRVSSLTGTSGTLKGVVYNATKRPANADVTIRLHKRGTKKAVIGRTTVHVQGRSSAPFRAQVSLPGKLVKGNYYISACTPSTASKGDLDCATAENEVLVKGGTPVRGTATAGALARVAQAPAETCSAGGRALSPPGTRVYPDTGNTGYKSVHTDVYINYDAPSNQFLNGTRVDLAQRSTQCLTEFSLDFERTNNVTSTTVPGPNLTVGSITINGQPATFTFKPPTYPGDPNGQDDPDPAAHAASQTNPVSATNPNPPACSSPGTAAALQGQPCPANKLVITPSAPIPSGTDFTVTVNYTGRPGVHVDGAGLTEGWFRANTPPGDGGFVTTEPQGTMAWMPLNNHPSVKPTYDFYDTTNYDPAAVVGGVDSNRWAIGNGRLISKDVNAPDANFPTTGSRTFHWKSPEPIASYLVENSFGFYDKSDEKVSPSNVLYYAFQASGITPATRKTSNKAIMDTQDQITAFQEQFNGPFPFSTDGVIIGTPSASFEEEMQTKITFAGGSISTGVFHHENMHQWWGDNVSEDNYNRTFFKEGYADLSEGYNTAWTAAKNAGGLGTTAGDAAFEASLANRFNTTYNSTSANNWNVAPSNPTASNLFGGQTYTRSGRAYIALRAILGKDNFNSASKEIQTTYGGGSITQPQQIAVYKKWLPNQSGGCKAKLDAFFKQWWDTAYSGSPAAGNKPSITGPGLAGNDHFYDANGGCSDYGTDQPGTPGGTVPATLSLSLGAPASFTAFVPGVGKDYAAAATATVISTAGDAALSIADPSATAPGHLVNGAFSLPSALKAKASSALSTATAGGAIGNAPLTLLTDSGPASNDTVTTTLTQSIAATDALRTGTYSKTLTFTLSTTTP
jgi:Peptidase family M1 domain